ncbi:RsmB/NOP family class I SAM-dependent RNA methyltransferase [Aliiroseovarius crassostreae]|uniref:RsmB/NOP family class I SAM-dependent RNA methyltransferase n=1 Tax=Aliiroseovarius crassostreae TaxID=154981 RepID=UPI0021FD1420|nr:RsmB/NOP family class I SAM-dependent RNA methyltransferase [Aliiroseovarius crassostreae]UWP90413.1 RsmB/NOP family class I SAM-dependent RNA methyltransferase [Aliiroseovarius crassostreae]
MTPAARISAAIEVMDLIRSGDTAEQALSGWARGHRFAGSKDRAAIRDHVFDALRRLRSSQVLGGGEDGRSTLIGLLRGQGQALDAIFTGEGHAPKPLSEAEAAHAPTLTTAEALDCPDWAYDLFQRSLGENCDPVLACLRDRAPVFLRVNIARLTREEAIDALARDGIVARAHPLASTALEVIENPRRVSQSNAYQMGLVELQDAASQALVEELSVRPGMRVLDYCAGGGGKSLAMAALGAEVVAHDVSPRRMKDIPERARRAGVQIEYCTTEALSERPPFDLVLADAPCSGSGSWRRDPQGKWRLTADKLHELCDIQAQIIKKISSFVSGGGRIGYATCSLFDVENQLQMINRPSGWSVRNERQFTPLEGGDGFYVALLTRD